MLFFVHIFKKLLHCMDDTKLPTFRENTKPLARWLSVAVVAFSLLHFLKRQSHSLALLQQNGGFQFSTLL